MRSLRYVCLSVLLTSFLLLGCVSKASAQFTFGAQVALNASNFIDESDFKVGGEAGLFFRFGKRVFFQPEVNYVFRNTYLDETIAQGSNPDLKQHFIDVPLLVGFHIVNNLNFKLGLFIGPRVGFRLADNWNNQKTEFERVQWGGQAGINFDFWRFVLTARYDISGNKFNDLQNGTNDFWNQNMFVVSLGFKIVRK